MVFDVPLGLEQAENLTVGDSEYEEPLRPYIRWVDPKTKETNYIYDAFRDNPDIKVTYADAEMGIGETGSASIIVQDEGGTLDMNKLNWGNKVIFKIAKEQWEFAGRPASTYLIGHVKGYQRVRPETNVYYHLIKVQGSKVLFNERKIIYKKGTTSNTNPAFEIRNHIKAIVSNGSSYPLKNSVTLQSQGGFSLSISADLKTIVNKVNFELIEAGNAIEQLVNIEGARWFIDYSGDSEILRVAHPTELHSGVVCKSGDLVNMADSAYFTSSLTGNWDADSDTTGSTGFANRLFTKTQIERKEFTSSFTNKGAMSLANKAIAQKFFLSETRITDLAFLLSKVGEPTSQNDRVNGRIIADNAGMPTGNVISNFNIPLSSIDPEPETIFVNDLDVKNKFITQAAPAWLVLYQRSGTEEVNKSEPNTDENNTIKWHHNNDKTTVTTLPSKTAASGDREDTLVWNNISSSTTGPTFGFGVFAEVRHIQELSARDSIDRYGLVEAEVDTSFLEDPKTIGIYLQALLSYTSKPRVVFSTSAVKNPSRFLFKPYQIVRIEDSLAYPNGIDAEIQKSRYVFDGGSSFARGCRRAEITPVAYYDYLDDVIDCA